MRRNQGIVASTFANIAILTLLNLCLGSTQAMGVSAKPPKPDLHAGGFNPSEIMNGTVTDITLPGFHLTGAHVDAGHLCAVVSYRVVSDNEIKMKIKGTRTVEDKESQCTINIRTPGGVASSWIVVDLTESEQKKRDALDSQEEMAMMKAMADRAGKSWHITFTNGSSETYKLTGTEPDGMATFKSSTSNRVVRIGFGDANNVVILDSDCTRIGELVGSTVKNGQSAGNCTPPGSWSGTVIR